MLPEKKDCSKLPKVIKICDVEQHFFVTVVHTPQHRRKYNLAAVNFGFVALPLNSSEEHACRRKQTSNIAKNHKNLALLNINCFSTVVLVHNSAEVKNCNRKKMKVQQCG